MVFPISGAVHFFGFFALLSFAIKSFLLAKKELNKIALFFGIGFCLISLSRLFLAIPSLMFLEKQKLWFVFEMIERSFLVIGFSFLGYAIFLPTRLKRHINKIFVLFILISIIIVLGFYFHPPEYFIEKNGILNWRNVPFVFVIINFIFVLFISGCAIFLFLREFYRSNSKKVKARSLVIALVFVWAILPAILDFFVVPLFNIAPIVSEINYFICYFLILLTIIIGYFFEKEELKFKRIK